MPFPTRFDVLSPAQRRLWPLLSPLKELGFCLYGGTALALRYGHRPSIDFDFFSDRSIERDALWEAIPWLHDATVLQVDRGTLVVLAVPPKSKRAVKVSFFVDIPFGRVGTPEASEDGVVIVASVRDLLATKLKVLFDRVEPRDYLDIAELLGNGTSLPQGLADARTLFGKPFSPAECLKILCWFEEPELTSLPARCKRSLQTAAKEAWNHPLPASRRAGQSLTRCQ